MSASVLMSADAVVVNYEKRPAVVDVGLTLHAGEVLVLAGPNGSGKSSLLNALAGQTRSSGTIRWWGKSPAEWGHREFARSVGLLTQRPGIDPTATVAETLLMGRFPHRGLFGLEGPADAGVLESVAARLGLTELLDRPMFALSGGWRQRVLLGRTMMQEPRALLLDEPEAGLDFRAMHELVWWVRSLAGDGLGVIVACHDLPFAAALGGGGTDTSAGAAQGQVALLDRGRLVAMGPAKAVLDRDRLESVYGVPMAAAYQWPVIDYSTPPLGRHG